MAVPSQSSNAPLESWCDVCAPERYPLATLQAPDGATISLERNSRWLPKLEIDEVRPRVELSTAASNLLQILKASSPADIGRELAIDKFGIPRLQSGLDNLLQAFPEESGVLAYRYERFAHKYLRRVLEELYSESGTRKKMPEGIFVGEQGRINARIVVGYNVEVRDGKALGYVRDHACSGEFGKDYFFQPSRKMRNLLDLVYDGSTVDAMVDYLRNHPRADWRRTFAGLRPEHFQAGERWTRKVVGASGGEEKREANVKGARDAMREYLKGRIGAPLHAQVLVADYLAGLEQVLGKLSRQDLDSAPSRHGGTFGNLRKVF
ncbi:MAG: hypothetical protein KDD60_03430, partial [Bdellovibrionales bacterium]|nr:hypothetical protein [Bdellovibrionales bacterium]